MRCVPLGDQAVLVYLSDEPTAVRFAAAVRTAAPPWLQDVVPAYASVGVFFDADAVTSGEVMRWLGSVVPGEPGASADGEIAKRATPSPTGCNVHPLPHGRGSPGQFTIPV